MVCRDDKDEYDPYRLAPRAPDNIVLPFTRPDESLAFKDPYAIFSDSFFNYYEPLFDNIINFQFPQDQGS